MSTASTPRTDAGAEADTIPPAGGRSRATPPDSSAWMLMLRGGIAILFGVLAVAWPGLTLLVLVGLFAAYALLGGVVAIVTAVQMRRTDPQWWLPLLLGIVSIVAGAYAVLAPAVTALALVLLMGVNAIFTGAVDIAMAVRLRRTQRGTWPQLLGGAVAILFGVLVIVAPGAGEFALVGLVSFYAIVSGALLFGLGWRMRQSALHQPLRAAAVGRR